MLETTGVPAWEDIEKITPPKERSAKGPVAVVECFQKIPCNPCYTSCPRGAMKALNDINELPAVNWDLCNGCGICVSNCPGLAIFIIDESYSQTEALVRIPYEFVPLPAEGSFVTGLDREGAPVCRAEVVKVINTKACDRTPTVTLAVPKEMSMTVRFLSLEDYFGDNTVICRCEEITRGKIRELINAGFTTVDEIKRISRAGMGICQGRTCRHLIQQEIAEATGIPPAEQRMPTFRPPVKPISLGMLFDAGDDFNE